MIQKFIIHWPALQVMIPFCAALICAMIQVRYAQLLTQCVAVALLALALYGLHTATSDTRYLFGGWHAPFGIEYRIDILSQTVIVAFSMIFSFYAICCHSLLRAVPPAQSRIYTIILMSYSGFVGMISSNDLFNIYVFLEIASIASYILIAVSPDKRALISAIDYLIFGSIGASLILIGTGIMFALTGSLNIDDIHIRICDLYDSKMLILGLYFFVAGCFLKIALFPLHIWMLKVYKYASPILLTYLAPASSIFGFYILVRFIYFVCDPKMILGSLYLQYVALACSALAIIFGSYSAFKASNLREIILHSSVIQIGYIVITATDINMINIAPMFIMTDILLKMSFFVAISNAESTEDTENAIGPNNAFRFLAVMLVLTNASLPFTVGFINKLSLFSILIEHKSYYLVALLAAVSILSLEYNYKLLKMLWNITIPPITACAMIPIILSFVLMYAY